jgi:ribose transport system ATP-binding protein
MFRDKIRQRDTTLYLSGISKTFMGTKALDHVDLVIQPGEIHGLLGQNGCGKSTLIKILSGYHHPDKGGRMWINGESVKFPFEPGEFAEYGLSFVHQDLGLIPSLTVLENLSLAEISLRNKLFFNWNSKKKEMISIFESYGVHIDMNATVKKLGPVERAMLAIIRAVEDLRKNKIVAKRKRGLLVLDEPTVFLPRNEIDVLFNLVRSITADGTSVMFVSHDLDEVMELTDSFTVLRDGKNVGGGNIAEVSKDDIIETILGRKLDLYRLDAQDESRVSGRESIKITGLRGTVIRNVNFHIFKGEVLGMTGLVGSGFEDIPYLLFGVEEGRSGILAFNNQTYDLSAFQPAQAIKAGIALIPADRANAGGIGSLSVEMNMMMRMYHKFNPFWQRNKALRDQSKELAYAYAVQPNDPELDFSKLSGGNQQKVLLSKWIQESPQLLILHEPTQGIDVGARQQVYRLIEKSVKDTGMSVLCCSSDYEQLEQICDRVLVLVQGKIVEELTRNNISKERITQLCYENLAI